MKGKGKAAGKSIFERIGGEATVRAAINGMYTRILGDVVLRPFFKNADVERIREQQVAFFAQALGGPARYRGRGMRELHADMKIEQRHFDRMLQHLVAAFRAQNLDQGLVEEIVAALAPQAADIVTHQSGEDALAADNRDALLYERMIEFSPLNFMRADADNIIRYLNPSSLRTLSKLEHLLPCKVSEIVGKSVDIFHKNPAHQRRILGDPKNLPHQAMIRLGDEYLNLLVSPIYDDNRTYLGPMVTWEVVTEKVRATAEIEGRNASLNRSQGIIECEMDGTIVTANEIFLKDTGYTLDEVKGKHIGMFATEEDRNKPAFKEFWAKLNRGEVQVGEFRRVAKGGREIWLHIAYNPIADENGKFFKVVEYVRDITEEKQTRVDYAGQIAAISKSQAIVQCDMQGTITQANENFLQLFGYQWEEIKGKAISMFATEEDRRSTKIQEFWDSLRRGEPHAGEFKRVGKGGRSCGCKLPTTPFSIWTASRSRSSSIALT